MRDGDGFQDVVAAAPVLDFDESVTWTTLVQRASRRLETATGIIARTLRDGFGVEPDLRRIPVDRGIAIPHLCLPDVTRTSLLMVRCAHGVAAPEGVDATVSRKLLETRAVFFLVSPASGAGRHLRLLGQLATRAEDPDFLPTWIGAETLLQLKATLFADERVVSLTVGEGPETDGWAGRALGSIDLPGRSLVVLVRRNGADVVPRGSTVLRAGDDVWIIGDGDAVQLLRAGRFRARETLRTGGGL